MDAQPVISALLLLLGLDEPETLAAALSEYAAPRDQVFSVPTNLLSKFLKVLKSQCPPESRAGLETAFMSFVSKDNGSLRQILALMAASLDSADLLALTEVASPPHTAAAAAAAATPLQAPPPQQQPQQQKQQPGLRTDVTWKVSTAPPVEGERASIPSPAAALAPPPPPGPALPPLPRAAVAAVVAAAAATPAAASVAAATPAPAPSAAAAAGAAATAAAAATARAALQLQPQLPASSAAPSALLDTLLSLDTMSRPHGPTSPYAAEPHCLRFGQRISLRTHANGALSAAGGGDALPCIQPGDTAAAGCAWELVDAASAGASGAGGAAAGLAGRPVCLGDVILLRCTAAMGVGGAPLYLTAAPPRPGQQLPLPANAGTEALGTALTPTAASPGARWTILSPDALIALCKTTGTAWQGRTSKPFIAAGGRVVLLSHAGSAGSAATAAAAAAAASATTAEGSTTYYAAAMRLCLLHAPPSTHPSLQPFVDAPSAAGLLPATGTGSSLSPAAQLHALVHAPPPTLLWSLCPAREDGRGPLPFTPEPLLLAPNLNGLHALLQPHQAAGSGSAWFMPYSAVLQLAQEHTSCGEVGGSMGESMVNIASRAAAAAAAAKGLEEGALLDAVLKAMQGTPSALCALTLATGVGGAAPSQQLAGEETLATPAFAGCALEAAVWMLCEPSSSSSSAFNGMEAALRHAAGRLLPLATHAQRIRWWCERRGRSHSGPTAQALASAAAAVLREFNELCLQLEREQRLSSTSASAAAAAAAAAAAVGNALVGARGALTLQALWHALQPSLRTLSALDAILHCPGAMVGRGGALLNAVSAWAEGTGDAASRALAAFCLQRAAEPTLRALERWMYRGVLDDPWGEFFVVEGRGAGCLAEVEGGGGTSAATGALHQSYWQHRFTIDPQRLPHFLAPHAAAILHTGKCMHILRLCFEAQAATGGGGMQAAERWQREEEGLGGGRGGAGQAAMGLGACVMHEAAEQRAAEGRARVALHAGALVAGGGRGSSGGHYHHANLAELRGPQREAFISARAGSSASTTTAFPTLHALGNGSGSSRSGSVVMGDFAAAGSPRKGGAGGAPLSPGSVASSTRSITAPTGSVLDSVFSTRRNSVDSTASSAVPATVASLAATERPAAGMSYKGRVAPLGGGTGGGGGVGVQGIVAAAHGDGGTVLAAAADAESVSAASTSLLSPSGAREAQRRAAERKESAMLALLRNPTQHSSSALSRYLSSSLEALASSKAQGSLSFSLTLQSAGPLAFSSDPAAYAARIAQAHAAASLQLLAHFFSASQGGAAPGSGSGSGGAFFAGDVGVWEMEGEEGEASGALALPPSTTTTPPLPPPYLPLSESWSARGLLGPGGDLYGHLRTLRTLFLCARADWVGGFLDMAGSELSREVTWGADGALSSASTLSLYRLRSILESALQGSVAGEEGGEGSSSSSSSTTAPRHGIVAVFAPTSLVAALQHYEAASAAAGGHGVGGDVYSAPPPPPPPPTAKPSSAYAHFSLSFSVPWPVSIVLRPAALTQYALLFRHVLLVRSAEAQVNDCWSAHQRCKALRGVRALLSTAHLVRHRMHYFLRTLLFHVTAEALEPAWRALGRALRAAPTVDAVAAAHEAFLGAAMRACFLLPHSRDLLIVIVKLLHLCMLFTGQMTRHIEGHFLEGEALDARVGGATNRAGSRARDQRERGAFALGEGGGSSSSSSSSSSAAGSAATSRRGSLASSAAGSLSGAAGAEGGKGDSERSRRSRRIDAQSAEMRSTLAQPGWTALIKKSGDMFTTLTAQLCEHLEAMSRAGDEGAALLLSRLAQ